MSNEPGNAWRDMRETLARALTDGLGRRATIELLAETADVSVTDAVCFVVASGVQFPHSVPPDDITPERRRQLQALSTEE